MYTIKRTIFNELGNQIELEVFYDRRGVTINAAGPTSRVEHTWTPMEAETVRDMLIDLNIDSNSQ